MDLLKYLEPMKHLPDRFSNLAFWRGCRKFKDAVVNAFEYVDSWGESVESELSNIKNIDYSKTIRMDLKNLNVQPLFHVVEDIDNDTVVIMFKPVDVEIESLPDDFGALVGIEYIVNMDTTTQGGSDNVVLINSEIIKIRTGETSYKYMFYPENNCCVAIDQYTVHHWTKPYNLKITKAILVYYATM